MIKIVDDFFENTALINIMNHIKTNCTFTPRFFENYDIRDPAFNHSVGNESSPHWGDRYVLSSDKKLLDTFLKQAEKKFDIKIKDINPDCGIDLRNMEWFHPHQDFAKLNLLVMLEGPVAVTNGTVFYTKGELDMHVGFRPNRAILFPSMMFHSPHKSQVKHQRRYTCSIFILDYENNK